MGGGGEPTAGGVFESIALYMQDDYEINAGTFFLFIFEPYLLIDRIVYFLFSPAPFFSPSFPFPLPLPPSLLLLRRLRLHLLFRCHFRLKSQRERFLQSVLGDFVFFIL